MTAPEDDEQDLDGMMGSMRGMWREMPDEEPPMRGLDALMTAARTKAAEMAPEPEKESWWRRTLAMLTRPPVLAAATVIVLVGSTMVQSRRSDMDTAATARAVERERPQLKDQEAPGTAGGDATAKGAKLEAAAKPDQFGRETTKPADRPVMPRPRPPVVVRPPEARPEAPPEPPKVDVPPAVEDRDGDPIIVNESGAGLRVEGQGRQTEPKPAATVDSVTSARPPAAPTGGAVDPVPQLIKQAETAAVRKDCAAVKATAERIRKLDATAYKSRVVTQAAIKRCL